MAAKNIQISGATTTTLLKKNIDSGNVNSITISNNDTTTTQNIRLFLHDGSAAKYLYRLDVPAQCAVVLYHGLNFDIQTYRMDLTTSQAILTVVIIE
jgi:hypothetical protein